MERLKQKHFKAKKFMPAPVMHHMKDATVGIIAYGSTEAAILEAQHQLAHEHGIKADFMRIRAIPFTEEVDHFIEKYDQLFVVEMNRDGQMNQILRTEYPQHSMNFKSVAYHDGLPAAARWVREGILAKYEKGPAATKTARAPAKASKGKKAPAKAIAAGRSNKKATARSVKKSVARSKRK
jgi:2-oxoglutarate/2-oxoacid ferredoxin oxidoreductase subunit alpha